jgi:hypothetical protein
VSRPLGARNDDCGRTLSDCRLEEVVPIESFAAQGHE